MYTETKTICSTDLQYQGHKKQSSVIEIHLNIEILTCRPMKCTINHPKFIASNLMEEPISMM